MYDSQVSILIELKRYENSDENKVFQELLELQKYISLRASKNDDLEYYVLSYSKKSDRGVYIVIQGSEINVSRETDLLMDFINSRFSTITCSQSGKVARKTYIHVPVSRNFY